MYSYHEYFVIGVDYCVKLKVINDLLRYYTIFVTSWD